MGCFVMRSAGPRPQSSGRLPKKRLENPSGSGRPFCAGLLRSVLDISDETGISVDLLS